MKARIELIKDDVTGKIHFRIVGSKLAAFAGLAAVVLLVFCVCLTVARVPGAYMAYEGKVIDIRNDWLTSFFGDEGYSQKCLVIEREDGKLLKRFVDNFVIFQQRIEIGDSVKKQKGFFKKPHACGKETMSEMLEKSKKMVR